MCYLDDMKGKDQLYKGLGEKIRSLRQEKDMTLEELAEKSQLGLSKSSIINIEKGRQQITVYQLYRFALALNVRFDSLLSDIMQDNDWHLASEQVFSLDVSKMKKFEVIFRQY